MTILEFLDKYRLATKHGWLTCDEALLLIGYAEQTRGALVEVGSYMGRSAMLLGQLVDDAYRDRFRPLYCIDPWADGFHDKLSGYEVYRHFQKHVGLLARHSIIPVRARVEDVAPLPAGFVYLDGDHTEAGTVFQVQWALQCQPQVIAIHDIDDQGDGARIKAAAVAALGPWTRLADRLAVWDRRE